MTPTLTPTPLTLREPVSLRRLESKWAAQAEWDFAGGA